MNKLALTLVVALSSPVAFAITPSDSSANDAAANDYWNSHAQAGTMTKEEAMKFKGADGKSVDWNRLDANHDGKVDHEEWVAYTKGGGADMNATNKTGTTKVEPKKAAP
jgi:hypothetical protein